MEAHSAHLVGGEIYYDCHGPDPNISGNYLYTLYMHIYRDCNGNGSGFDDPAWMVSFDHFNIPVDTFFMYIDSIRKIPTYIDNPCLLTPPNVCVEAAYYSASISIEGGNGDLTISNQRCCRNNTIVNIVDPGGTGSTYTTLIKDPIASSCNSSPRFNEFPPLAICNDYPIGFDHSASDPDGDSLVYKFSIPLNGADEIDPHPYANAPPYKNIQWESGYSTKKPMLANPSMSLSTTGFLDGNPIKLGQYVVGISVVEYRKGVLLSRTFRDFQFNVVDCSPAISSSFQDQSSFCSGFKYKMHNNSFGAGSYFWDFGVANSHSDTSREYAPTFVFPDTGFYEVMLIANPNWPCADTSINVFDVRDTLKADFVNPDVQCMEGNKVEFRAAGKFAAHASFEWQFDAADPPSSNLKNPIVNYIFHGIHEVYLTIKQDGCERSHKGSVELVKNPTLDISINKDTGCMPLSVNFSAKTEFADVPEYTWNLGDGTIIKSRHVSHIYKDSGLYDIGLQMINKGKCRDTLTLIREKAIKVLPLPKSAFSTDRSKASKFESRIYFTDASSNTSYVEYHPMEGVVLEGGKQFFVFPDTGRYHVMQVSYNEYGCSDTSYKEIYIYDEFHCYFPNAFTPNGDGNNEYFMPVVSGVKKYDFQIYNRWGELIFQSSDPKIGWDGNRNGSASQLGKYVYSLEVVNVLDEKSNYRGTFLLLR